MRPANSSKGLNRPTGSTGFIKFDRDFRKAGGPRIQRSSGTRDVEHFIKLNSIFTQLFDEGRIDALSAFQSGELTLDDLQKAEKKARLHAVLMDVRSNRAHVHELGAANGAPTDTHQGDRRPSSAAAEESARSNQIGDGVTDQMLAPRDGYFHTSASEYLAIKRLPLWSTAFDVVIPSMTKVDPKTRERYAVSINALKRLDYLDGNAVVFDLVSLPWDEIKDYWLDPDGRGCSAADWNHLKRAIGRFLTVLCKTVTHPIRSEVVQYLHLETEGEGRMPDCTPALFKEIADELPERYQPLAWLLVGTGLRISEALRLAPEDLRPATHGLAVNEAKTESGVATKRCPAVLWHHAKAVAASDLRYRSFFEHWWRAVDKVATRHPDELCDENGVPNLDLRIHDLRHLYGQWAINAGASEESVQAQLGHRSPYMTRRYTRQLNRGKSAAALDPIFVELLKPFQKDGES